MDHLDHDNLTTLKQVMEDDFGLLIETFKQDSLERIKKLREVIQGQSADAIRRAAHSFKGSSSNIGAQRLSSLCAEMEKKALAGKLDDLAGDLQIIEQEFAVVESLLDDLVK